MKKGRTKYFIILNIVIVLLILAIIIVVLKANGFNIGVSLGGNNSNNSTELDETQQEPENEPETEKSQASQETEAETEPETEEVVDVYDTITISAAGDVTLGRDSDYGYELTFDHEFERQGGDYGYFLRNVKHIFEEDDISDRKSVV